MLRGLAAALVPSVAVLLVALPAGGATPRTATLRLQALAPLTISGRGFGPRERVLLLYSGRSDATAVASVRATRRGTFTAVFRRSVTRCDSFTVRAIGAARSRAVLQIERRCGKTKGPPKRAPRDAPMLRGTG